MDVFSHGLWTGAIYKTINNKKQKPLNVWKAVVWGVFPDIFSFAPLFIWLFYGIIFGNLSFSDFPRPEATEPASRDALPIFALTSALYSISHSLLIFLIVFGLARLVFKRPIWEMGGWFFHILIDIPTHSYKFYPTPFLWPISSIELNGFSWANPRFMILNYSAIIIVYLLLWRNRRKNLI